MTPGKGRKHTSILPDGTEHVVAVFLSRDFNSREEARKTRDRAAAFYRKAGYAIVSRSVNNDPWSEHGYHLVVQRKP